MSFVNIRSSRGPVVKVCGLQSLKAAQCALDSDADLLGIICVPGRERTVDPVVAMEISALVRACRTSMSTPKYLVGVFRNQSKEDVLRIANDYGIDIVQLHGDEPWQEYQKFLGLPVIKRLVFPRDCDILLSTPSEKTHLFMPLFDSEAGGTGELLDWNSISDWFAEQGNPECLQFMLAGGLTPENVSDALQLHGVIGVDVSGGVETNGMKDMDKITNFVRNAKKES
ncbi:phosphoribosylanthranilate isomerase TRP1 SKDI_04G2420 [Saccharomyces kudriavzevii IFO 1802]|uniref:N-(5'-phosphoribosyl)anthranilate isomerase n=2 Tax=Saccharomyces kudriavzevii (strain ATCC MYA-4449 / AS 2.2408 / CBS 8840 / NBRC 1802 / NCYC 2889) TaxID=226230 RepID=TRPF_SACK1|nr:uncharacterized protein SKDI_04G2420 [Saccharomyces kudriavzevii IFO 1802]Q5XQP9.1 RecName: Full=N-(5'-phosphoribosyl)anthranilate isomerase; Short=PRAI [Saccharomyces kudriavzevii IFO 1802]AAU43745.1 TRP1 [Saccharomyces kudriavzevii IFO 1802]EJT43161.1 TRP1-like protein [Saccharomyces kudriavzevii IFO 1802]CAI4057849.1 hypothetical protein SKDI_04G2420 [Saccharomyces kudriavzevii IFO 1802]